MLREALGYARGREDASGTSTAGSARWISPALAFARTYANIRVNGTLYCPALEDAYNAWQGNGGTGVIP